MSAGTDIKRWQERTRSSLRPEVALHLTDDEISIIGGKHMLAEIAELRAALEAAEQKLAQRDASVPAEAAQNDDLPPLTMTLYGTRELLEAERMRRQDATPYAYDIRDTNGDGCLRLAKDVDPRRLIAVTVTPLYTAAPAPVATVQPDSGRDAALMDLQYDAGARAGFMAGAVGDDSFIAKMDRRIAGAVGAVKLAAQQGEQK